MGFRFWRRAAEPDEKTELDRSHAALRGSLSGFGYQWLCACAVYPELRFTLSVALGQALAGALGRTAPLTEEDHAALFALPWFRAGVIPMEWRERLAADLSVPAARATREAIRRLLAAGLSSPPPPGPNRAMALPELPSWWGERIRALVETARPDDLESDPVLARFMAERKLGGTGLARDRWLRRHLKPLAGWGVRRTALGTALALGLTALLFWQADARLGPRGERVVTQTHRIETFRDCPECPEMAVIPAGTFMMGSPDTEAGRYDNEGPQHRVQFGAPFALARQLVTRGQFRAFVTETGHDMTGGCWGWTSSNLALEEKRDWLSPGFEQADDHPVVCVSWQDAQAYLHWLSRKSGKRYRLPGEAEWEYAARAGTTTPYWTGQTITPDLARFSSNGTASVGSYPPNAFGLHDMVGNVRQWLEDPWDADYQGAPADGSAWTTKDGNPTRVVRGGSWLSGPRVLRSAFRGSSSPDYRDDLVGFRVARTLTP